MPGEFFHGVHWVIAGILDGQAEGKMINKDNVKRTAS